MANQPNLVPAGQPHGGNLNDLKAIPRHGDLGNGIVNAFVGAEKLVLAADHALNNAGPQIEKTSQALTAYEKYRNDHPSADPHDAKSLNLFRTYAEQSLELHRQIAASVKTPEELSYATSQADKRVNNESKLAVSIAETEKLQKKQPSHGNPAHDLNGGGAKTVSHTGVASPTV